MAIEKDIPQDICQYESKLIGPLTTRQVGFLVPGAALAIGAYVLCGKYGLSQDVKIFLALVIFMPFLLCGWVKLYGINFEKFVSMVFVSQFLAPKHRLYKTENTFDFLLQPDIPIDAKKKKKETKAKENYVSKNKNLIPFK